MTFRSSIPTVSFAEPLSVTEIDMHPDRDRIWSTLRQLELEMRAEVEALEEDIREAEADRDPGENAFDERRTVAEKAEEGRQAGYRAGFETGYAKGYDAGYVDKTVCAEKKF